MKKKVKIVVESINRGQGLYSNYTVVRVADSAPLFIKDADQSVFKKLKAAKDVDSIIKDLGERVLNGNPNTEKPKPVKKPVKKKKK